MNLVIVESPTKARTITRYLGKDFVVLSSFGHVRDLPKRKMGIEIDNNFSPQYEISEKAKKTLNTIKTTIKQKRIKKIILATDEDREGEAIAFHLQWIIKSYTKSLIFKRITFHEITKQAIQNALKNPREIDLNLFNAQQARRILDRLVGYSLSPILWKKIRLGLSAGRVQSVALRLVVDREKERQAFKQEEYWTIQAKLEKITQKQNKELKNEEKVFSAFLKKIQGKKLDKLAIKNHQQADEIKKELKNKIFIVTKIIKKETQLRPAPPFKTSTLQREAANKLGFSAKQTMVIAQQLYEGIRLKKGRAGLITYMRTDSLNISQSALKKAQEVISKEFGKEFSLPFPRYYSNKTKGAQEAHEAIRPTFPQKTPQSLSSLLTPNQLKLYRLIWQKFIGSQMKEAKLDKMTVYIETQSNKKEGGNKKETLYEFIAQGSLLKFAGFLKAYGSNFSLEETRLPNLKEKEIVNLLNLLDEQHFTQPPPRYNDASLIKALEENGIGRPSTYAPTLSTILNRGYVIKDEKKQFVPEEIGFLTNDLMVKNFPQIVDLKFTAEMENNLDSIAEGKREWVRTLSNFFTPFQKEIKEKSKTIKKYQKEINRKCPQCKKPLVEKFGRFGKFFACSGYPECKFTEDPRKKEDLLLKKRIGKVKCKLCGADMELRRGRFGTFLGCSQYPKCKGIKKIENKSGISCNLCQKGEIVEKRSRRGPFWACNNYPACKNILKGKPTGENCPQCGEPIVINLRTGEKGCFNKKCK